VTTGDAVAVTEDVVIPGVLDGFEIGELGAGTALEVHPENDASAVARTAIMNDFFIRTLIRDIVSQVIGATPACRVIT
jgi:hypothetical protein